jgi:hypothetical protein
MKAGAICRHTRCAKNSWPAGERIPRNREEAIKLGWAFAGSRTIREDELTDVGEAYLRKKVGALRLTLTIPYTVTLMYGRPGNARVVRRRVR